MPEREGEWQDFTSVERAMARRMERTAQAPIATGYTRVDVTAAMAEVAKLREELGLRATFTTLVIGAVALALDRYPAIAASVDLENWKRRIPQSPNVGFAVAAERGLVVPVIKRPARRSIDDLIAEFVRVVGEVKGGATDRSLYADGDFSMTNLAGLPIYGGTPLPATPQIAILGVGSAWEAPVVVDGEIKVSRLARFTVAHDHRAVDGMTMGNFVTLVKEYMEDPQRIRRELGQDSPAPQGP